MATVLVFKCKFYAGIFLIIDSNTQNIIVEEKEVNCVKNKIFYDTGIMNSGITCDISRSRKLRRDFDLKIFHAELKRYSKGIRRTPQRSPSPCSISGMVAERKKIFEP